MSGLALKFIVLWGWRRLFVASLAGLVAALSAPPVYLLPSLAVALPVLVWILDGAHAQADSRKSAALAAFLTGWAFGFGYFAPNLYWLSEALLVEAEIFAWMIPFVLVLFPLCLAVFYGLASMVAGFLWAPGMARIFALAAAFAGAEWLRGHVLSGFPWVTLGYSAGALEGLEQLAAWCGVYGLTFLIFLTFAAPAVVVDTSDECSKIRINRFAGPVVIAVAFGIFWILGTMRLNGGELEFEENLRLRIIQPNIPQAQKWEAKYRNQIFSTLLELSDTATTPEVEGVKDVSLLIWPESAIPFLLEANWDARLRIADMLAPSSRLITGLLRRAPAHLAGERRSAAVNSVIVLEHDGRISSYYDKAHLVPFGEYLPLASILEPLGIRKIVTLPGGFVAGPGTRTITMGSLPPVSILICYEIIFPGAVTDKSKRPRWLLNLTNDAWFGSSIGPRQHFAQARMRAIEEGLPLVRSANTGISAIVDPYGRVVKQLPLEVRGILDGKLPKPLPATTYARMGDLSLLIIVLLGFGASFFLGRTSGCRLAWSRTMS